LGPLGPVQQAAQRQDVGLEISAGLRARIDWWENYTKINGGEMNNNPSPRNNSAELSTILKKSPGAVARPVVTT
jgi:arabinonate dehydratase